MVVWMSRTDRMLHGSARAHLPVIPASLMAVLPLVAGTIVWRWSNGPTWDEAVYIARATLSDHWQDLWGSSRMFGVPFVLAPVLAVTDAMWVARVWFALVTAALAVTAVRWWMRVVGSAFLASFAALVVSWQFLWFAPALMPNLPGGLAALALCAWTVLTLRDDDRPARALAGTIVAFLAFSLRWVDALLLWSVFLAFLGVVGWRAAPDRSRRALAVTLRGFLRRMSPALVGVAASMVLWILESRWLFGSAWARFTDAGEPGVVGRPLQEQLEQMIWFNTGDGGGESVRHLSTLAHLPSLLVVSVIGVMVAKGRAAAPVRAAWSAGMVLLGFYLWATVNVRVVATGDSLHRFVIPALVFVSVPVGVALTELVGALRKGRWRRVVPLGAVFAILAAGGVGSASMLGLIQNVEGDTGTDTRSAAARMNEIADGRECFFYVQYNYPAMQLETPCRGDRLAFHRAGPADDDPIVAAPVAFLYGNIPPAEPWILRGWELDSTFGRMSLWVRESPG